MNIQVCRYGYGKDSTGGLLYVDGKHIGYTCEDQRQPGPKVQDETCIPYGKYRVLLRDAGGMNEKYRARFDFHRGMLHLQDVPDFTWIYIHVGNTDDHTSGCILVGKYATKQSDGEYTVGSSTVMYKELYEEVCKAIDNNEEVLVEVV